MAYQNTNPKYGLKAEKVSTVQMQTKKFDIAVDIISNLRDTFDNNPLISSSIYNQLDEATELLRDCIKQR